VARDDDVRARGRELHPVPEALPERVGADHDVGARRSGADGARTHDLVTASHALSQLSYSPKAVLRSHCNARELPVPSRHEPEVKECPSRQILDWDVEALVKLPAVRGDAVDFGGCVSGA
jgi:hypothetical protein